MQTPSTPPVSGNANAAQPVNLAGTTSSATSSLPQNSPLTTLGSGSIVEGFVLNRGNDGSFTLRTSQGDVTLKSDIFLKSGAQLSLRVESAGGQSGATILTIDKRPFSLVAAEQRGASNAPARDGVQLSPQSQPLASSAAAATSDAAKTITLPVLQASILETTPAGKQQLKNFAALLGLPDVPEEADLQTRISFRLTGQTGQTTAQQPQSQQAGNASQTQAQATPVQGGAGQASAVSNNAGQQISAPTQTVTAPPAATPAPNIAPPNQAADADLPPQLSRFSAQAGASSPQQTGAQIQGNPAGASTSTPAPTSALPLPDENAASQHRISSQLAHHEYASLTKSESPAQLQSGAQRVHLQVSHQLPAGSTPLQITGEVIGHDPKGASIIKTPIGTLSAAITPTPERGATLQLELVGITLPALASSSAHQATAATTLGKTPGLDALLAHLTQAQSGAGGSSTPINNPIPQPGANFAQNLLGVFNAIRTGNFEQWIGRENLRALKNSGGDDAINNLRSELGSLRAASNMPADESQWQSLAFPLLSEDEVQQAHLHYRKEEKETEDAAEQFTRFIVEVSMSVFGLLQLDGLVVKNAQPDTQPKMDVAVRTAAPLPITMREDIMQLYSYASEFGNFQGSVKFYAGENVFFELPRAEEPTIRSRKSQDGIVT